MGKALDRLIDLLDLEQIEVNIFRGRSPEERVQRVFGGQVAGQALVAAGRTVPPDRPVHSLHAYFIRPGDPAVPIVYLVDRVRDGRSFTTRRVSAVQHGETIFTLSASFHHPEPGPEHADPMPDVPPPEAVERNSDRLARLLGQVPPQVRESPVDPAGRTVPPDRPVHSLHAYFIRPGDPAVPIVYLVDRVRDGRSFTTRRVSAVQHGETIFTLSASFHHPEPGPEHADPMPDVPPPEAVERNSDRLARLLGQVPPQVRESPVDLRSVGPMSAEAARDPSLRTTRNLIWLRVDGDLPDDPLLHVCLMTYASDMTLLDSVLLGHGLSWLDGLTSGASLDHAMWFHRPFRADRWLLYAQDSPVASGARGLAHGEVFTAGGELVVSVMQEGLIRSRPRSAEPAQDR